MLRRMTEFSREFLDKAQTRAAAWVDDGAAERWARRAVVLLALFLGALFLYAAARRLCYPFEVEWIESGMLVTVLRVLHGQGIYVPPTLHYVPYLYAPVYFYLAAAATKLTGIAGHGYAGLRLLSALATLGGVAAIYRLVRFWTPQRVAAIAAAGLYAGCYSLADSFFDVGRVDSLFVLFVLLALLAQQRGRPVLAALVWVLAFQTKQTVLPLAIVVLCAELPRPRRFLAAIGTYCLAAGASVTLFNHATGGWYGYYLFQVARGLPVVWRQVALYLPLQVLAPLAVAWVVIGAAVVITRPRWSGDQGLFVAVVSLALFGGTWFVQAHRGASTNAMMPVYAWTAVLFGVAMGRLLSFTQAAQNRRAALLVTAAVGAQLVALVYNPGAYVPPVGARAASDAFVAKLTTLPGDVYVLNHSYDEVLAGKQIHAEGEALGAVLDAPATPRTNAVRAELAQALAQRPYSAVVVDSVEPGKAFHGFDQRYPLEISTGLSGYRFITSQAQWFLLPCNAPSEEVRSLLAADTLTASGACNP
jgi:hypothetical protein